MFCKECGTKLSEQDKFCNYCGCRTEVVITSSDIKKNEDSENGKSVTAFIISLVTLPVIFVIAMLGLEEEYQPLPRGAAWGNPYKTVLPDNVRMLMMMVLMASTIMVILMRKSNKPNKVVAALTIVMLCINIVGGLFLSLAD